MNKQAKVIYIGKTNPSLNIQNTQDYIEAYHLMQIFTQTTKILLKKNNISSQQIIGQFLQQSNKGQHVLLKSYGSFNKSYLCRICFIYNFVKIFEIQSVQRNGLDYFQLSRLLCSDFPKQYIAKASRLLMKNQNQQNFMYKLLPSKKFIHALYMYVIYGEYFDTLHNYFKERQQNLNLAQLLSIIKIQDANNIRDLTKPPFSIIIQSLLKIMKQKGMFTLRQSSIIFLTQENIQQFFKQIQENNINKKISINQIMEKIIDSQSYIKLVNQKINMFDNSSTWASQVHKLLIQKDPTETPLNVKKKAAKK